MISRLHIIVYGIVQGVGYRYSTYRKALQLGIKGWVRNKSDGSVEAIFEGPRDKLEEMLSWCQKGPSGAIVSDICFSWEDGPPQYGNFEIHH